MEPNATPHLPDAVIAEALAEIGDRLAALASSDEEQESIARELGAIRAQLRMLAQTNADVGAKLGESLGLHPPVDD